MGTYKEYSEAVTYIQGFVGPDLTLEMGRRLAEGQRIGLALINAGDRADRPWAWGVGWGKIVASENPVEIAEWLKNWGASVQSEIDEIPAGSYWEPGYERLDIEQSPEAQQVEDLLEEYYGSKRW